MSALNPVTLLAVDANGNVKEVRGVTLPDGGQGVAVVQENNANAGGKHDRFIKVNGSTLPADIGSAKWDKSAKVTGVQFKLTGGTAGDRVRVVFDATPVDDLTDKTQAEAWLTAVTAAANAETDVEYMEVAVGGANGVDEWSEPVYFGGFLQRVDAIAVDQDVAYELFVRAV